MSWTLTLPYERPPKGLHSNDRVHHMVKARSTKNLRERIAVLCRVAKIPKMQRVSVQVVWVVPTRHKRDADGPDPMCKHQPGVTAHFRVELTDISNPFRPDAVDHIAERLCP